MAAAVGDGGLLERSRRILAGEADLDTHPFAVGGVGEAVGDDVFFVPSFANVAALRTRDGLVVVDTGSRELSGSAHEQLRGWTDAPVSTVVFTHGHIDHVFGVERYEAEADEAGRPRPVVVAHEALPARFDRYRLTAGYNGVINGRQFRMPGYQWPTAYRYPDRTYRDELVLDVGGRRVELHHGRGETDDATWVWVPDERTLFAGDFVIWSVPNCGNPQKVQRYPLEWAVALRRMASLDAEVLLPGHGLPVAGAAAVRTVLTDAAALLESLCQQTLDLMNEGATLDRILTAVRPPADLIDRPWLRPVYDEPEFVVRNLWRLYGGWWDGNPARLKPAPDAAVAEEVAALAGGTGVLVDRARALLAAGDERSLRLAGQLAEWAAQVAPADATAADVRAEVAEARVAVERSLMAKGVFSWTAVESRRSTGS
ncbi:MAG TPA: alkyl sulfatase dimerization domain-containing protein [Acidimicrobiales bacterium]